MAGRQAGRGKIYSNAAEHAEFFFCRSQDLIIIPDFISIKILFNPVPQLIHLRSSKKLHLNQRKISDGLQPAC